MGTEWDSDIVVVGVGTCGEDLSLQLMAAGLDVVGVEAALIGGECPYWACLPSKRMIRMGNLVAEGRRADGRAASTSVRPDWGLVARQVRDEVTGGWDDEAAEQRFRSRGGRLLRGRGRLAGPRRVVVGDTTVTGRRGVVIATGSSPAVPPIPGLQGTPFWTTHDVIHAVDLPESLLILGGGAVGCELGQLLARFGVEVTIVEAADRLLATEEPEVSDVLSRVLEAEGVTIRTGTRVAGVDASERTFTLDVGEEEPLTAERLLVATGRRAHLGELGLETVGLDPTSRFLPVDDRLRAADGLWAMGDVTGQGMLTHVALAQADVVAADLLGRVRPPVNHEAVPRVVFTDPEVGAVGVTEERARGVGLDVVVVLKPLGASFRGWLHAEGGDGFVKLVADRSTGCLVGATAVGPRGGDVLGLLGLAVHARVPLEQLRTMVYAFPTFYGVVGEALGAYGRGVTTALDPGYDGVARLDAALEAGRGPAVS